MVNIASAANHFMSSFSCMLSAVSVQVVMQLAPLSCQQRYATCYACYIEDAGIVIQVYPASGFLSTLTYGALSRSFNISSFAR